MKNKHRTNYEDTLLLKLIHDKVQNELVISPLKTTILLSLKLVFYAGGMGLTYYYMLKSSTHLESILLYTLFGFVTLLFAFNFGHDLSHNTIFKSKKINHLGFVMVYTLVGAHAEAWKIRHINSHHFAPNVEDYDSDLQITSLIRVIPDSSLKKHHRLQHLYAPFLYTFYSLYWIFYKDVVLLFGNDPFVPKKTPGYYLSFLTQKAIYFAIMILIPYLLTDWNVLLLIECFVFMHLFISLFLLFTFFITHHVESTTYPKTDSSGIIEMSWVRNQIQSSNDFHPFSHLANFIFGGFNNHIAHHLFPHVNHIYYPRLNRILYATLAQHGIRVNRTTFFGGITSHLLHLKTMGTSGELNKKMNVC